MYSAVIIDNIIPYKCVQIDIIIYSDVYKIWFNETSNLYPLTILLCLVNKKLYLKSRIVYSYRFVTSKRERHINCKCKSRLLLRSTCTRWLLDRAKNQNALRTFWFTMCYRKIVLSP